MVTRKIWEGEGAQFFCLHSERHIYIVANKESIVTFWWKGDIIWATSKVHDDELLATYMNISITKSPVT